MKQKVIETNLPGIRCQIAAGHRCRPLPSPWARLHSLAAACLVAVACGAGSARVEAAAAANVMNYGADGNDYFQFTTPSLAFSKASGFTTLIAFAMHVDADGTLEIGGGPVCSNGVYVGPTNWPALVTAVKTPPTTVTRYEVCIGGWLDTSFDNIKALVAAQGAGPASILYRNFQALKNAVPGIDAINDDDEQTYHLASSAAFANMLGGLGYKFTTAPYSHQTFWVNLNNSITNCDFIYLQCYAGGAGNDPVQWNAAFGNGTKVIAGQESNTSSPATFRNWYLQTGAAGGFYYPDVLFGSTYWSAAIIQAGGAVPAAPTGVNATLSGNQVRLAWNVVPGAMSYNVKRSTASGAEVTIGSVSTTKSWPASNLYFETAPVGSVTYYYKVTAVNTNGEGAASAEVSVKALSVTAWFKADTIVGLNSGDGVALWPDASGRGHPASQTNASQQPIYMAGAWNGLPAVRFDAAGARCLTFSRPVQDDFTMFCVFRGRQGAGAGGRFSDGAGLISGDVGGVSNDFGACLFADGTVGAGVGNPDVTVASIAGFNDGLPHLLTFKRTQFSGEASLYVDGKAYGTDSGTTNSLTSPLLLALGGHPTLTNFFSGDIAEVKIYGSALSDSDRAAQETALSQKWGVTGALAGLLAYDGFDYPAGAILAGRGGGIGWSNVWTDVSGTASEIVDAGLSAGTGAPAGFDGRSAGNGALVNNNSRGGRWLDCSATGPFARAGLLDGSARIGANGKTVYVSFLLQPNIANNSFYEFEFHRGDLADPGRIAGIGCDVANSSQVYFRAPAGTQTPLGLATTNVNLYVVRINFKSGNDDVYVYRNPTGALETDNEPVLTQLAVADMSFDGLAMAAYLNGATLRSDEIRVGQSWNSVLGNPPVFVTQPAGAALYAGQDATLAALAQSYQPLKYQWYCGGSPILGATNASLVFSNAQPGDAGQYYVVASNALGAATSVSATLSVTPISVGITSPQSVTVGDGSNLVITASAMGAPPVALQWYRDGVAIAGATGLTYSAGNGVFDAGIYSVVATNASGSVTSSVVSVVPNFGGLLAYEGFNYGTGGIGIAGASGGFGWANAWLSLNGPASQTLPASLVAGANSPSAYDLRSAGGALFTLNGSRQGRFFDCTPAGPFGARGYLDASGNIGADGKTIYLSFLQQPDGAALFYELEFHRDDLGDGGRMGGIGNDTGDNQVHLRVETPPGGASTQYDLGAGDTNVNFYVVRIDFKPGNDDIYVYRNPTSATEPATPTLSVPNAADMSFDGVSAAAYVGSRTVRHDEVRVGTSWADVLGVTRSQLQLAQRAGDVSQLRVAGSPNYTFGVQAATNVAGPWSDVGVVPLSDLGIGEFMETNTAGQRFYRATNAGAWLQAASAAVFADFEQPTYGAWTATGTAFGSGPAQGTLPGQQTVSGYVGAGLVNSYLGGDASTGTLTSPPFVITKPYLNFLIGGGAIPGAECMNLIVSNAIVRTATGGNNEALSPRQWDVSAFVGQTAMLQILDTGTGSWGHINIDQIEFSDSPLPVSARSLVITNPLLNLPVQNSAPMRRVTVTVGGQPVRDFNIRLAPGGTVDWWSYVDVSPFAGQAATLSVSSITSADDGFYTIFQTNGIAGATNLYRETLRPQLHFSSKRGWLNDANGMVYYNGKYHLYYQHDPFDWGGAGQKWWGHAVSPDMVNWEELQEGIYSHSYGDDVWSGSAVVDTANTGGFKTGTNDVIVAAYYSTARGECIAFSNDGGLSYTDYTNNPVVVHSGAGRDPHLFWYAPSNYWVTAVYDDAGGHGIQFFTTPDFRQWTFRSKIYNGFFECPDIFPLPVDGNPTNLLWLLCDASSTYQLGQFDGVTFTPGTAKLPGNNGAGYYASQTFTRMPPGDNRVVRMGWAQISTPGMPFNQLMYFPTELSLKTTANGPRLCNLPVAEITNNAVATYAWSNLTLTPGSNPLAGIRGTLFDVKAQFSPNTAQSVSFAFQGVTVTYNALTQQISCNGYVNALPPVNGGVQLEIIVDRNTVEIFGNGGLLYMPLPVNNPPGNSLVSLTCSGGNASFTSLTVSKLHSTWPQP
jgi:fructan beta-fructosidase